MTRQLILAVVEPTPDGETTLNAARDHLTHGGDAALLLLLTKRVRDDIRAFAESEDLDLSQAEGIAERRLREKYARLLGVDVETIVAREEGARPNRLATTAETVGAATIAVPQGLLRGSGLRRLSDLSHRTVVVTPRAA